MGNIINLFTVTNILSLIIGLAFIAVIVIGIVLHRQRKSFEEKIEMYESKIEKLNSKSNTDELTKIYNRHYMMPRLDEEWAIAKRHKRSFCVSIMDINNLKKINDTYGHITGDELIRKTADILAKNSRDSDIIGRIGGDEFLMISIETKVSDAQQFLSRIKEKVKKIELKDSSGEKINAENIIGLSTGTSLFHPKKSIKNLIDEADAVMYVEKSDSKKNLRI